MNNAGDAADQVVRISVDGAEFVLRIAGGAAKEIAAFLYAAFQDTKNKQTSPEVLRGRERLKTMLKTGKPTEVFSVKDEQMKDFAREAKRYGVGFTMLRSKNDSIGGQCDLMVFQEDAPRITRILENLNIFAQRKAEVGHTEPPKDREAPEQVIQKDKTDILIDELLEKPSQKEQVAPENPAAGKTDFFTKRAENHPPSETSYAHKANTSHDGVKKMPVRTRLYNIQRQLDAKKQDAGKSAPAKQQSTHKPKNKKKTREGK